MAAELSEWEKITPRELIPAIKHTRETFDEAEWKYSEITRQLCYAALHPQRWTGLL